MTDISLRWYQERSIQSVFDSWELDRKNSVLISLPTGAGKTIVFSSLIERKLKNAAGERAIILVHRDKLLKQAIEKLNYVWPGAETGIIKGKIRQYDKQVTVASVATLDGRIDELLEECKKHGPIKYLIIDEAHHSLAPSWRRPIESLLYSGTKVLGVTATPFRSNEKESLGDVFECMAFSISIFQLIKEGFLSKLLGLAIITDLTLSDEEIANGDYDRKYLGQQIMESPTFNLQVVAGWKDYAHCRRTICFAVNINHVETLTSMFNKAGARAAFVHGEMPVEEQDIVLEGFKTGTYNILVNCDLLTEGFDETSIDCVLMARPTASRTLYCQMLGRGLRPHPGKEECLLLDFTANAATTKVVTMEDLLGFHGLQRAEEAVKKRASAAAEAGEESLTEYTPKTIAMMESGDNELIDEITTAETELDVFNVNKFNWTEFGGNTFVTARMHLSIAIVKEPVMGDKETPMQDKYSVYLVFSIQHDRCVCKLADKVEKEFAEAVADVYLYDFGDRVFVSEEMSWRQSPPGEIQIASLEKAIAIYRAKNPESDFTIDKIDKKTKGRYSDYLTAIYSTGYIQNPRTPRIDRETAMQKLRRFVVNDLKVRSKKKGDSDDDNPGLTASRVQVDISGNYNEEEHNAMIDMIVQLSNDTYSELAVQFLMENPIVFKDAHVVIKSTKHYTNGQYRLIKDKISMLFRPYFRNRKLIIANEKSNQKKAVLAEKEHAH